jgi:NitT/TauT family transport system ATP-binding protein
MVFQEWALLPWKSVRGNIELGLQYKKIPKKERDEIVNYFACMVGLEKFLQCYPRELSGGMKQRVGLARALANDPRVILLDEPFASVDAQTRLTLQEELLKIWAQANKTMIFVTHSVEEAVFLADRVGILTAGPSKVKEIKTITLPRPRSWKDMQDNPLFSELKNYILEKVRQEVVITQREEVREI